jgi:DNA-binding transcriptional regulator YhcF (GntR family)
MRDMAWNLDTDRPIYAQLVEKIQMQIVSGFYPPGAKLPSVRELAAVAAVNPNTMQKAFTELERGGLIVTQRTNGRTVTEDEELITSIRDSLAKEQVDAYFLSMSELGYERREAVWMIRKNFEGEENYE